MPDWNRIIVGDAFKSHDVDYYRDLFLIIWPFLLCSVVAISTFYAKHPSTARLYGFKLAACAVLIVLLAKEKRVLILVSSCYVALRFGFGVAFGLLFLRDDLRPYLLPFLVSGGVAP